MALATLIGGAIARLIPEGLRVYEGSQERKHEKDMTEIQRQIDKDRAQFDLDKVHAEGEAQLGVAEMKAYEEALRGQGKTTGMKFVDAANALVRPITTYWMLALFSMFKIGGLAEAIIHFTTLGNLLVAVWSPADMALFEAIMSFWFVDRVIRHNTSR